MRICGPETNNQNMYQNQIVVFKMYLEEISRKIISNYGRRS